jgi:prephenate dehydrogenase
MNAPKSSFQILRNILSLDNVVESDENKHGYHYNIVQHLEHFISSSFDVPLDVDDALESSPSLGSYSPSLLSLL